MLVGDLFVEDVGQLVGFDADAVVEHFNAEEVAVGVEEGVADVLPVGGGVYRVHKGSGVVFDGGSLGVLG